MLGSLIAFRKICKCVCLDAITIQFTEPEQAFLLKSKSSTSSLSHFFNRPVSRQTLYNEKYKKAKNGEKTQKIGETDERGKDDEAYEKQEQGGYRTLPNHYSFHHSSFYMLKGGHIGNAIKIKEAGLVAEQRLDLLPAVLNATVSQHVSNLVVKVLESKVSHNRPCVRVFVHQRAHDGSRGHEGLHKDFGRAPCVVVYALFKNRHVSAQCRPRTDRLNSCVVDLILPLSWWPERIYSTTEGKKSEAPPTKRPKSVAKIAYRPLIASSFDEDQNQCHNEPSVGHPGMLVDPKLEKSLTQAPEVQLISNAVNEMVGLPFDKTLNILVPNKQFRPNDIFTATVFYRYKGDPDMPPPYLFQIKCQAMHSLRILGTEEVADSDWTTSTEMIYQQSALTITAFYRGILSVNESWSGEIITLLLQIAPDVVTVTNPTEEQESAKVNTTVTMENGESSTPNPGHLKPTLISTIMYVNDLPKSDSSPPSTPQFNNTSNSTLSYPTSGDSFKPIVVQTSFNIEKDSVKCLIPIGKFDLVNTAVLTGNQVSVNLNIFSLTYAGIVTDITLQANCAVKELSVFKVTPGCTAVYADGSESRGDAGATVNVTFGAQKTRVNYHVWYPEFPVDVSVADPVLHAIKNWRIDDKGTNEMWQRVKRNGTTATSSNKNGGLSDRDHGGEKPQTRCRLRYQESVLRVYARFRIDDLTTGRRSYLGGRKTQLDVTYLSRGHLKVAEPRLARLKVVDGNVFVQGLYPGRTEIQLISSYSKIPFGVAQIEITNEQLSVRNLKAEALASLSVSVHPDANLADVYHIVVHKSMHFTKQYQDGRISIDVEYSNGFSFPLSLINIEDYTLEVAAKDGSLALMNFDHKTHLNVAEDKGVKNSNVLQQNQILYPDYILRSFQRNAWQSAPTFLVVEETKGNVLYVSLFSAALCQRDLDGPLYSTTVYVEAVFDSQNHKNDGTLNKSAEAIKEFEIDQDLAAMEPQRFRPGPFWSNGLLNGFSGSRRLDAEVSSSAPFNRRVKSAGGANGVDSSGQGASGGRATPAHVATFIFLALFALVGAVFALHCFAANASAASAVRRRRIGGSVVTPSLLKYPSLPSFDWFRRPFDSLAGFLRHNAVASARREFVWVGPEELHDSLVSGCSRRLLQPGAGSVFLEEQTALYNVAGAEADFEGVEMTRRPLSAGFNPTDQDAQWIDNDDEDEAASISLLRPPNVFPSPQYPSLKCSYEENEEDDISSATVIVEKVDFPVHPDHSLHSDMDSSYAINSAATFPGYSVSSKNSNVLNSAKLIHHDNDRNQVFNSNFNNIEAIGNNMSSKSAISYLGSEVSIIMSQKPTIEVHERIKASSWSEKRSCGCKNDNSKKSESLHKNKRQSCFMSTGTPLFFQQDNKLNLYAKLNNAIHVGRASNIRITTNPISDSSSEQNLSNGRQLEPWLKGRPAMPNGKGASSSSSTATLLALTAARSASDLSWDSASLGMNEMQLRDYFNSLRESMA